MTDRDEMWTTIAIAVLVALTLTTIALGAYWAGVSATEADRQKRIAAVEACDTIEEELIRADCIREAG